MTERSEVHVTVDCSPLRGEPVTGAGHARQIVTSCPNWTVHQ